jgi:glycosyltransferase involved in cell wall biosynthesis
LASIPHPDGGQTWLENVTLLGHLSGIQMMDAYRRAGVYASPARYEPFGLTVLEAALHGCPLVLSDIPTFRELWHGAALFLPVDDQSAWRRTLNQLAKDETQRAKLGMAARERATRFSAERMAQDYFAAYQQLRQRFAAPSIHSVSAKAV